MSDKKTADTTLKAYATIVKRLEKAKVNPLSVESVLEYFDGRTLSVKKQILSAIKKTFPDKFPEQFQKLLTELYLEQNENDKIGQAEDENGADLAEDGGEEFVVEEVADVTTGHFSCGGGGAFETAGTGDEGVG